MSLQNFEQQLQEVENKFKKKFEDQQSEFYKKIEDIKNTALESILKQKPVKEEKEIEFDLDETIDANLYAAFSKKPYFITPGTKNSIYVMIPKFKANFQVGWLKDEIDEYYRYEVNQYSVFFGDVPKEILQELKMPDKIEAEISGNIISFDPEDKAKIKKQLPKYLTDWTDGSARITQGHEFDIISQLLESGKIPFDKTPVEKRDLIAAQHQINLRDYQSPVWNNFLKTGASGIFHPTGAGKSFIGMKGLESLKVDNRRNLIISPRKTLVEQWEYYIKKHIPDHAADILITTYQGFKQFDEEFGLTLYDECQALPAPNFSKLSTIKTKYRMGLSATPFREDGKNHLIITLTGFPESLNWPEYMEKWGPGYHQITVHIVNNRNSKFRVAKKLFNSRKRTMIYSYNLQIGQEIADKLDLNFIHGETINRLQVMNENHSFVASSVFTEGISIQDLDHIIEIDFHFGSRREELQLTGRLMHSQQKNKRHDIIMTEHEFDSYKKRILVLEEKGFHVKIIEDGNDGY